MNTKSLIWLGVFVGSTIGSFIPALWGESAFSISSIFFGTIGGLAGIWGGFRLSRMI